jgi:hypothetical protein
MEELRITLGKREAPTQPSELRILIVDVAWKTAKLEQDGRRWLELSPEQTGGPPDLGVSDTVLRIW